ncbi:hypothetical protein I314_01126 [Cryptococcus bacillisporus CA1873]|uniref:Uncharacterized protein n=1 Tax=Cryptococcus bacillisporus CA1873 TaxID=1296111 RepID=A0ABR5BHU7_CRYGA|nr:hypothetical protein I314_01126 [Cryptococcus bacillisporus CA1873]|eukprot:KIR68703.1 hypothetical protein I314_01126 [Cryptococcus gattii CA1873]
MALVPTGAPRDAAITIGPSKPSLWPHPMFAAIWVDYDDTETVCSSFHNVMTLLTDTSLLVIYEFRNGITCADVLFAIYDFFASPLYVDELGEMPCWKAIENRTLFSVPPTLMVSTMTRKASSD